MTDTLSTPPLAEKRENIKKHPRTPGLRLFDVFLYPFFTNFVVFAISVAATYLTSHGADRGKEGKLIFGKLGTFFHARGEWLVKQFQKTGMSRSQADMSKMVFFSFADGTLVAPFVKLFEDRREKIARKIDEKLGTVPDDPCVYDAEPKQSWLSVIAGRFATAAVIVPTAVALDKTGLNDRLFSNPGQKTGEWLATKPAARFFGNLHLPGLFKTVFFEFFYTSVCTAGLYFSSRLIARFSPQTKKEPAPVTSTNQESLPEAEAAAQTKFVDRLREENKSRTLCIP